jgi:uncharacterized protein
MKRDHTPSTTAPAQSTKLNWAEGALAEGLACYQREEFFQAHEHWESVWLHLQEPEKSFLQALIQMTVAFHHLQVGNSAGAASLLRKALHRFEVTPASVAEIAISPLSAGVSEWLHAIESGAQHDRLAFPHIYLLDSQPGAAL